MENSAQPASSSEESPPSRAVNQLARLCRRHPLARKIVFVPYSQLGQALTTAVARHMGGIGGLECQTPRSYAARQAAESTALQDRIPLGTSNRTLLVQSLLSEAEASSTLTGPNRSGRLAPQVADAIQTLRLGRVRPEAVRDRAASKHGFLPLLAETYGMYVDALDSHNLYDDADLFNEAIGAVQSVADTETAVYVVFGETELHECALDLMNALRERGQAFYSAGAGPSSSAPEMTASATFLPELHADSTSTHLPVSSASEPEPRFQRAVGPVREIRSVLRDVLRRDRRLDEVEIAYTTSRPYLSLAADEAERLGVPFTLGTGLPMSATRVGQALAGFYEWIENGYDTPVLIRLLRSGLLQPEEWMASREDLTSLTGHQIASVLAEHRYGPGADAYLETLDAAMAALGENDDIPDPEALSDRDQQRLEELAATKAFVQKLVDLIPNSGRAQEMAAGSLTFLSHFGPPLQSVSADEEAMVTEAENTTEEIAEAVLREQVLDEVESLPVDVGETPQQMAKVFGEMVQQQYLGAQNAAPGAVHVLPLDSAGFSGRKHLYVVGMDSESASTPAIDEAVLSSSDREAFGTFLEGTLPKPRNAPDDSAWRFGQALKRHEGTLMLVATAFDPEEGESRHPSTLYLQKRRDVRKNRQEESRERSADCDEQNEPPEPTEGLIPSIDETSAEDILFSDSEAWLATAPAAVRSRKEDPAEETENGDETDENRLDVAAREHLHCCYPWVEYGEAARSARRSNEYTVYDGLLATDVPELDFLNADYEGPPISAGRLETLAASPYAYFLQYVLRVEPREEPALDEEPWLNPRRKGIILHRSFSRFMSERGDAPLRDADREELFGIVDEIAEEEAERVYPGTEATLEAARRELKRCARLFFESERSRSGLATPLLHEWGFGYKKRRRQEGDIGNFDLDLPGGSLPVRGRIDRVDRLPDASLAVWDYKTGSQSSFSRLDPLKHGEKIQWALYALVLEQYRGEEVAESGYFFTSEKEMGTRLSFPITDVVRQKTADTIADLAALARTGSFPIHPKAHRNPPWRFGDWDALHRDLKQRLAALSDESSFAKGLEGKVQPYFLDPDE